MKILAIDGGGIRGVFAAYVLQLMEEELQQPLYSLVDMVGGTSTGAIIAGALATKMPMEEVVHFYVHCGNEVFRRRAILGIQQPFYSKNILKEVLHEKIGDMKLTEVKKPLLIPAANLSAGDGFIFRSGGFPRTDPNPKGDQIQDITLLDAILSSCSAPIFFAPEQLQQSFIAADGGLWANNPSLVCLTEAMSSFGKKLNDIEILSLGCGVQRIRFTPEKRWGLPSWIHVRWKPFQVYPTIIDLTLHLTSESISEQMEVLCQERYLRINTQLGTEVPFDQVEVIHQLLEQAQQAYERHKKPIYRFFDLE